MMKPLMSSITCLACLLLASCQSQTKPVYNAYFESASMRIDYFHEGDARSESVEIDAIYRYGAWAGSKIHLLDSLDYGSYYHKIYDKATGTLIYSKGFDSYFKEYQLTTPAINGERKEYHESAIIPMPKDMIVFALEKRDKSGKLHEVFKTDIDPQVVAPGPADPEIKIFTSLYSGDPNIKADVAIIGEGYTSEEEQKFQDDLKRFTEVFFRAEPCRSYKDRFNIRGVLKYSEDSGVDEPRAEIDKNTAVNASFNALGSERYLLTEDNKSLRDIAGHVPYDALYIMVNHSRYGGGGIYNFYCVYTSDNMNSDYLMVHEFGHSFFGLADEYYTSSTAYNDFYSPEHEPAEPNITAMQDPENIKWKHLLSPGIELPTPWEKDYYDSLDLAWQEERAKMNAEITDLKRNDALPKRIEDAVQSYNMKSLQHDKLMKAILDNSKYAGQVGAFEGAGYVSKGLYRPTLNCIMFSRVDYFCPVCQDAMIRIIDTYSE